MALIQQQQQQQQQQRPRVFAVLDFPPGCGPNALPNHLDEPENGVVEDGKPIMTLGEDRPKRKRPSAVWDFPFGCGPNRIAHLEECWDECDGVVLQCPGEDMVPINREGGASGRPEKRRAVAVSDFPAGFDPDREAEGPVYPDSFGVIEFEGEIVMGEEDDDSVSWPPRNRSGSSSVGNDGNADDSESEEVPGFGFGA